MDTLLEAASWAFSSNNAQPWNYIYAHRENKEPFEKLVSCLLRGNKEWAKDASVIMVALANKKMDNGHENIYSWHDVGAANANLMLQAVSMNIYGQLMGGFDSKKAIEVLNIDLEKMEPVVFIALGYLDSPDKLEEPFKTRELTPRSRRSAEEFSKELK